MLEILESISDPFYCVDREWNITYVNRTAEQTWQVRREDLIGHSLWVEFPEMVGTPLYDEHIRAMQSRQPVRYEAISPVIHRWVAVNVYPKADGGLTIHFRDIEEQKQAEQALKANKERLEFAIEAAGASAWVYDLSRDLITVVAQSPNWTRALPNMDGLNDKEALDRLHPGDRDRLTEMLKHASETGEPFRVESRQLGPDGKYRWVLSNGRLVTDPHRQTASIFSVSQDITEQKRMEEELRESELRFRTLAENLPDPVIRFDLQQRRLYANPASELVNHLPLDQMIGKTNAEIGLPPELASFLSERFCTTLETCQPQIIEFIFDGPYGQRNFESRLIPEFAPDGAVQSVLAISRDVTERVEMEKEKECLLNEVKQQEERFNTALKHSPVSLFHLDRDQRYCWVFNPTCGLSVEDYLGKTEEEVFPDEDLRELTALRQQVIAQKKGAHKEILFINNGHIEYDDITVEPTLDENGEVNGLIIASVNTTPLRQLEQEVIDSAARIKVQQALIEQREQERTQIARELHDGPLQELIAATYSVRAAASDTPDPAIANLLTQINQILHSQIQTIREFTGLLRPPIFSRLGFEDALQVHVSTLLEKYPELSIALNLEPIDRLTSVPERLALFRICQESLNNVIKHAHASHVSIAAWQAANHVELQIRDDGIGFQLPADWVDLAESGHLGLVGIRERAEAVGGQALFSSQPGSGTLITVRVPILPPDEG